MTEKERLRLGAGIVTLLGWSMVGAGVTVLWGWPGTLIVLGLLFAVPARYMRP